MRGKTEFERAEKVGGARDSSVLRTELLTGTSEIAVSNASGRKSGFLPLKDGVSASRTETRRLQVS